MKKIKKEKQMNKGKIIELLKKINLNISLIDNSEEIFKGTQGEIEDMLTELEESEEDPD
jgi:hypothetical protein